MANDNLGPIYSDNFKRWFGDWENDPQNSSKVVDSNGVPYTLNEILVCALHSSHLSFKCFIIDNANGLASGSV